MLVSRFYVRQKITIMVNRYQIFGAKFKARQRLDVHAEHHVFDERGTPLGYFRKDFGASLLRWTWHLSAPGLEAIGRE